jgi:hypothetical protein
MDWTVLVPIIIALMGSISWIFIHLFPHEFSKIILFFGNFQTSLESSEIRTYINQFLETGDDWKHYTAN